MSEAAGGAVGATSTGASSTGTSGAAQQGNEQIQGQGSTAHSRGAGETGKASTGSSGSSTQGSGQSSAGKTADSKAGAGSAQSASSPAADADELEEIKIGGAQGKVPKALAKALKDLERGFHGKSQEAAMTRKEFQSFVSQAKANPEWFFQQTGVDPDQFSQAHLAQKLQRDMMSPEQRRAMELEQENKRYREDAEKRQASEKKSREEREFQELSTRVRQEALSAIGKSEELRDDPYLVQRVFAVKAAVENQKLDWDWEKCVQYVENETRASYTKRFSSLSPQQLEERLGPEALSRWREFDLKRVTEKSALAGSSPKQHGRPGESPASPRSEKKSLTEEEWRNFWK